jgi:hypothetical protein
LLSGYHEAKTPRLDHRAELRISIELVDVTSRGRIGAPNGTTATVRFPHWIRQPRKTMRTLALVLICSAFAAIGFFETTRPRKRNAAVSTAIGAVVGLLVWTFLAYYTNVFKNH